MISASVGQIVGGWEGPACHVGRALLANGFTVAGAANEIEVGAAFAGLGPAVLAAHTVLNSVPPRVNEVVQFDRRRGDAPWPRTLRFEFGPLEWKSGGPPWPRLRSR